MGDTPPTGSVSSVSSDSHAHPDHAYKRDSSGNLKSYGSHTARGFWLQHDRRVRGAYLTTNTRSRDDSMLTDAACPSVAESAIPGM